MSVNVAIHSTAVVAPEVEIGPGTVIGPHAVVLGPCRIGADCWIGPGTVIGTTGEHTDRMVVQRAPEWARRDLGPEDQARLDAEVWSGPQGEGIEIGDRTIIREQSTVQQGVFRPTVIGSDVFLMNKVHVAHDCLLGDRMRIAPLATLAGHVVVGEDANLGMGVTVHQWRSLGQGVMVGMNATVTKDASPFTLLKGSPARPASINRVLLERLGWAEPDIEALALHLEQGGDPPAAFREVFERWEASRQH